MSEEKPKFTDEEIKNIKSMGKNIAGKVLMLLLMDYVSATPDCLERKKLLAKLKNICPEKTGFNTMEFQEMELRGKLSLVISLCLVGRDDKVECQVPDIKYAEDLYGQYDFFKGMAMAHFMEFRETHKALYTRLQEYLKDVNLELTICEDNPTTMYFEKDYPKRIGVIAFYVGPDGRPFVHNK